MSNSLRFYVDNLVDQSTITASTENALYPTENLQDPRRTKVFRSTTNSDSIVFDFGETSNIDSIMIVDGPDGLGVSAVTLELNGTNTWGAPAFSQVVTLTTTHGVSYAEFASQSYRFARLVLTSTLGYCELSKVFLGQSQQIGADRSVQYNWSYQSKELSKIQENQYGTKFIDIISRQKQINFSINLLDKDELDDIFELYDTKGISKPFFMRLGCNEISNDFKRYSGMFYLNSIPQITNSSFNRYNLSMSLEEAK